MWGQKFGFVLSSSLSFPFKHFAKIQGLFFKTALVVALILALVAALSGGAFVRLAQLSEMPIQERSMEGLGAGVVLLLFVGALLAVLALVPFLVGIIRSVVTDETADSSVVTVMFKRRQFSFIWSFIKISLLTALLVIPIVLVMITVSLAFGMGMSMTGVNSMGTTEVGALGFAMVLFFILAIIPIIVIVPRWYMAPVTAALDKGSSIGNSWNLTRGSWFLIVLSMILVSIVVNIFMWVASLVGALFLVPLGLLVGPLVAVPLGVILYAFAFMLAMVPGYALYGYLYLVMTDQVKFGEDKVKRVKAAS